MLTAETWPHTGGDDTEEGEVADNSEPEDVDSDHNGYSGDRSPRPRTSHKSIGTSSTGAPVSALRSQTNDHFKPDHFRHNGAASEDYIDTIGLHDVDYRIPFNMAREQHFNQGVPNQPPVHSAVPQSTHFERFRNSLPQHPKFLPGLPPVHDRDGPPPTGTQEEIEKMHEMYHRACQLYEQAKIKVGSSGFSLPPGLVPEPPPIPLMPRAPVIPTAMPHPTTHVINPPIGVDRIMDPVQQLPPPTAINLPQPIPADIAVAVPESGPPKHPIPSVPAPPPATSHAHSHYGMAYSLAYKQTVEAMPAPTSGGPTPDTPEYAAMWQHYMDYYLRYYLHAFSSMQPTTVAAVPQPEVMSVAVTSAPVATLPTPVSINMPGGVPTSIAVTDSNRPPISPKGELRSPEKITSLESAEAQQNATEPPAEIKTATIQDSSIPSKQSSVPVIDDLSESKCVWISNLPQGVKAVDVKERCSPYGRVQTIKIIGSRKSIPPAIYAYLVMETAAIAKSLVDGLQGAKFDGQEIKIKRINALPIP